MNIQDIFSSPINVEIIALLFASALPESEKRTWISMLAVMNHKEKTELKENLQKEVKATIKLEQDAFKTLGEKVKELFPISSS